MRSERDALAADLSAARRDRAALARRLSASERERARLRTAAPAERTMRRAFTAKVEALALTHARTTARMLNVQKRCFEEELESLEGEAQATVLAFERQLAQLREEAAARDDEHARDRDAAYAKTAAVMARVRARFAAMEARAAAAEAGRDAALAAARERHTLLEEVLRRRRAAPVPSATPANVAEPGVLAPATTPRREAQRKNAVIAGLQRELSSTQAALATAREEHARVSTGRKPAGDAEKSAAARRPVLTDPEDAARLGKLFASVITDFAATGPGKTRGRDDAEPAGGDLVPAEVHV